MTMHPVHLGTPDAFAWFRKRNKTVRRQNIIGWAFSISLGIALGYVWLKVYEGF